MIDKIVIFQIKKNGKTTSHDFSEVGGKGRRFEDLVPYAINLTQEIAMQKREDRENKE